MSSAPRYIPRYTVDDYRQWEGDWELIDGLAIAMTPSPFGPHARVVSRLSRIIGTQVEMLGCPCEIYTNLDWIVGPDTVVRPDLMVVCGEQPPRHLERPPALVVEVVSESNRDRDAIAKRAIYHEQAAPHFLLIDPQTREVELLAGDRMSRFSATDRIEIELAGASSCRIAIDCNRLFD